MDDLFLMEGTTDTFTEPSSDLRDSIRFVRHQYPDFDTTGNLPQVETLGDTNLESVIPLVYKPPTSRIKSVESVLDMLNDLCMGAM